MGLIVTNWLVWCSKTIQWKWDMGWALCVHWVWRNIKLTGYGETLNSPGLSPGFSPDGSWSPGKTLNKIKLSNKLWNFQPHHFTTLHKIEDRNLQKVHIFGHYIIGILCSRHTLQTTCKRLLTSVKTGYGWLPVALSRSSRKDLLSPSSTQTTFCVMFSDVEPTRPTARKM